MKRHTWFMALAVVMLTSAASGCSQGGVTARPKASPAPAPIVYAALGASESAGVGTADPARESFPQQLYHKLPRSAVLYNFGLPGETIAAALNDEVPQAVATRPTLVTVWFNVDDMLAGVPVADYETRLDQAVTALRREGAARVLVANTPRLDHLPAYLACRPNPPPSSVKCALGQLTLPAPDQLNATVDAYNAAISRVAARRGAVVVDLAGRATVVDQHPEYVSSDGFHPSAQGAAAIADAFATAASQVRASAALRSP